VWFTTQDYAQKNPATVKRFIAATYASGKWANAHHAESLQILRDASKADFPSDMRRATYAETLDAAMFQPIIDNSAKYGALSAPFPAAELFATGKASP